MQYSSVMKQLKQYRLNTVFNVSIVFWNMGIIIIMETGHHVLVLIIWKQHLMSY